MRLTNQTDFALRTLMYLIASDERVTSAQVADVYGISVNHMAKVVNQLVRNGFVRSLRGVGGGIELACDPKQVTVGQVVEAFEGRLNLHDCVTTNDVCVIQPFCRLRGVLAEAERVQMEYLHSVTLADVVPSKRQYVRLEKP